ncbi:hypothetical protein M1293_01305 [Candidatus Parvarchaeota archaeon]|nr:hypothetical protein [Candidatus Parvarchaeota archaeon]
METVQEKACSLDDILCSGLINPSDKEVLKILDKNPELSLLETDESMIWGEDSGDFQYVVGPKNFDKYKTTEYNASLDINKIRLDSIKDTGKTFLVKGKLKYGGEENRKKDLVPDLSAIGLNLSYNGRLIDLGGYSLYKTRVAREFYGYERAGEKDNVFSQRSVVADLVSEKENMKIVYRMTFNGNKMVGSRLYLNMGGKMTLLKNEENYRLVDFMNAISIIHDRGFRESECSVVDLSVREKERPDQQLFYIR